MKVDIIPGDEGETVVIEFAKGDAKKLGGSRLELVADCLISGDPIIKLIGAADEIEVAKPPVLKVSAYNPGITIYTVVDGVETVIFPPDGATDGEIDEGYSEGDEHI